MKRENKIALLIAASAIIITMIPLPQRPIVQAVEHRAEDIAAQKGIQEQKRLARLEGKEVAALRHTRDIVKGFLKAPATAKFPWVWDDGVEVTYTGNGVYRIRSYVD